VLESPGSGRSAEPSNASIDAEGSDFMFNQVPSLKAKLKTTVAAMTLGTGLVFGSMMVPFAPSAMAQDAAASNTAVQRAQALFNRNDLRGALNELNTAVRANPNNAQARLLRARVFLRLGQGVAAQTEIEQARQNGASRGLTAPLIAEARLQQRRFSDALDELNAADPSVAGQAARVRGLVFAAQNDISKARAELARAEQIAPNDVDVKIDLARVLGAANDRAGAEAAADRALTIQPANPRALIVKGGLVRARAGLQAAVPFFNSAVQADPGGLDARLERAATLVDLRRENEAREDLKRVFALVPNHPLGLYLEAVMRARATQYQEAQALMGRTKGLLDNYPPALLLQGVLAYETNNIAQAETYLQKLIAMAPDNPVARRIYGATLMKKGDADGAINTLRPLVEKGQADSRLLALYGTAFARKGDFNTASQFLERAVAAEPNQTALRTQLAMSQIALGQNQKATSELDSVLKVDPNSLQAMLMRGLIDLRTGNYQAALQNSLAVTKKFPQLAIGYNMVGAAYLGLRNLREAEKWFQQALARKADYHEARRNLAQLYRLTGRFDEARRELQRVLDSDRNNVRTMLALADVAQSQGRNDERIEWLRRAVQANQQLLPPRLLLIQSLLEVGDRQRALSEATAADRDFEDNPAVVELLGRAQAGAGQPDRAISTFQRLTKIAPNNAGVMQLLARAQWDARRPAEARSTLENALKVEGPSREGVLVDLINLEAQQNNFPRAIQFANQLRQQFPNSVAADATLGGVYLGARQFPQAIQSFEAAKRRAFSKPIALGLARAYTETGQIDRAVGTLREWGQRDPRDLSINLTIADTFMNAKRYPQALAEYQLMVRRGVRNAAIFNNIAWIYNRLNDNRARIVAEEAYRLSPDTPEIQDTLGWILVQRNIDVRRGLSLIERAAGKLPQNLDVQFHYAAALRANGRSAEAQRILERITQGAATFDMAGPARAALADLRAKGR
jgi:cellulose synthase operon protein C